MPENAPASKKAATEGYGGIIQLVQSTQQAREEGARLYVSTGQTIQHPVPMLLPLKINFLHCLSHLLSIPLSYLRI